MNQAQSKYEVLVVDDSPVQRKLVERALSTEPFSLVFAGDGTEAMKAYEQRCPCLVITDWMLPDFSGLELCQRIRSDSSRPYTYIIVMTSNSDKSNVVQGLRAGADDYVTKPFDPAELLARVSAAGSST